MSRSKRIDGPAWIVGGLLLILVLAGCAAGGPAVTSEAVAPSARRTLPPGPFNDIPEAMFIRPDQPAANGAVQGLRGLYGGQDGNSQLLQTCRREKLQLVCAQYPLTLDAAGSQLVEVDGQLADGKLAVDQWQSLAWDEEAHRAAAQAELAENAGLLAMYDWSTLARPDFSESTAWFKPEKEQLAEIPLELYGYDTATGRVIWRGQGREMPQQKHLVHRYPVVYLFTDPQDDPPAELFVTIEGYVEE